MTDRVQIDWHDDDTIAHVTLNRPDKMNALDDAMFDALCAAGDELKESKTLRAVVISGAGKSFCAGLDLSKFGMPDENGEAIPEEKLAPRTHGAANKPQYSSWVWRELEVPVIAALHGAVIGGGCQIALGADMRYVHPEAKVAIFEMQWGIIPDMGATPFLLECVADDVARELIYTNRMLSGIEAKTLGLATEVYEDPLTAAFATAREIALRNPDAVRAAKRLLNKAPFLSAEETLQLESTEQDKILGHKNQMERAVAVMMKRTPNYS